jgi:tetratricopeptide (TPR) repeat protein
LTALIRHIGILTLAVVCQICYGQETQREHPFCEAINRIAGIAVDSIAHAGALVEQALISANDEADLIDLGRTLGQRAEQCYLNGAFNSGITLYALEGGVWAQLETPEPQCIARANISKGHHRLGQHLEAMRIATDALAYAEEHDLPGCKARSLVEMTWNYLRLKDFDRALESMSQVETLIEQGYYDAAYYYNAAGCVHLYMGDLDAALSKFTTGLAIPDADPGIKARLISNMGPVYTLKGDFDRAIAELKRANRINADIGSAEQLSSNCLAIGGVYYRKQQLDSALYFIREGIRRSRDIGDRPRVLYGYGRMADIYSAMGDYQLAYEFSQREFELNDSLYGAPQLSELLSVEWQRHLDHKQNEIDLLTTQKELQELNLRREKTIRNLSISIGVLILLFGGWLLYNIRSNLKRKEEATTERFTRKLLETEMSALKAQMNPHFLFNTLNSIKLYIVRNEPKVASEYLAKFARLVRLTLQYSNARLLSLEQEREVLELYILMESIRTDNAFDSSIEVAGDIDTVECKIPPMLLQPYVENAIWHGLANKKNGRGQLSIRFARTNGFLRCTVEDNGVGRQAASSLKKQRSGLRKSLGMKITGDRIALINQMFDKESAVRIDDLVDSDGNPAGTVVTVQIPFDIMEST